MAKNGNGKGFPPLAGMKAHSINLDALLGTPVDDKHLDAVYSEVEPTVLQSLIWAVTELGGTIQFGRTKNGKAYTLKLYIGKPYDPIYFDGDDTGRAQMAALAQGLVEAVAGMA